VYNAHIIRLYALLDTMHLRRRNEHAVGAPSDPSMQYIYPDQA
jgi:hypothetical protein